MGVINKSTEAINTLLDKVENMPEQGVTGKTPVLETGKTTTLAPGQDATSEVVPNGTDESGNPKYKINFGIPRGADGTGEGGGGVADSVQWKNVLNKPTWVNSSTKPSYTAAEVGALPASTTIPSKTSQLTNDSKFVASDGLKTINGQSIVGIGNIEISGSGGGIADAPSDGKTYGRKNGNWSAIEGVGGSVDITDIINRLAQLAEVDGTCTDEDYNTLKRYIENGTVTYYYIDEIGLIVDLKKIENIILIEFGYTSGFYYINSSMSISGDKHVSVSGGIYLSNTHMGEGVLGEYKKPTSYSAISKEDSISTAIGKLEAGLGSGSGGANTYEIPSAVLNLTEESTADEIKSAFGGDEGIAAIKTAIGNKAILYISNSGDFTNIINVNGTYSTVALVITFTYKSQNGALTSYIGNVKDYFVSVGVLNNVSIKYKYGVRFTKSFYDLRADSSSDKILSALNISGNELYKRIGSKSCNKFYISDPTNNLYVPLSVKAAVSDGIYLFSFSAVADGIWGTSIGGILGIMYTLSSNTYQIIALEEIALKQ